MPPLAEKSHTAAQTGTNFSSAHLPFLTAYSLICNANFDLIIIRQSARGSQCVSPNEPLSLVYVFLGWRVHRLLALCAGDGRNYGNFDFRQPSGRRVLCRVDENPADKNWWAIHRSRAWVDRDAEIRKNHNPYAEQYVSRGYCPPELRKDIAK